MPTDISVGVFLAAIWFLLWWVWRDMRSISRMNETELFELHDRMFGDDHAD